MSMWRLAKSLETMRAQIDALSPNRSRASDGTIGDAAHASRSSDHNPWIKDGATGVVTALDITHDPLHGIDSEALAEQLRAWKDGRIKYVISNRKIFSGTGQSRPAWQWRKYTGVNPHNKHVHISVKASKPEYDRTAAWRLDLKPTAAEAEAPSAPEHPRLAIGSRGEEVRQLQAWLNKHGAALKLDAEFGPVTKRAVQTFQKSHGLAADGVVGPYTWEKILTEGEEK